MNRVAFRTLIVVFSLVVLASCGGDDDAGASSPSETAQVFKIDRIEAASSAKNGASRDPNGVKIHWSGSPEFPVKSMLKVTACPPSGSCPDEDQTYQARANPLLASGPYCFGRSANNFVFRYEIRLTDADGVQTAPVSSSFTCTP